MNPSYIGLYPSGPEQDLPLGFQLIEPTKNIFFLSGFESYSLPFANQIVLMDLHLLF